MFRLLHLQERTEQMDLGFRARDGGAHLKARFQQSLGQKGAFARTAKQKDAFHLDFLPETSAHTGDRKAATDYVVRRRPRPPEGASSVSSDGGGPRRPTRPGWLQ